MSVPTAGAILLRRPCSACSVGLGETHVLCFVFVICSLTILNVYSLCEHVIVLCVICLLNKLLDAVATPLVFTIAKSQRSRDPTDSALSHIGLAARRTPVPSATVLLFARAPHIVSQATPRMVTWPIHGMLHLEQQVTKDPARILCNTFLIG